MIYLSNITDAQVVYVPRDTAICGGTLTFKATSTVDLKKVVDVIVLDLNATRIYYNIAVSVPTGTTPGEYKYEMKAGDDVVSTGLLVIGEYTTDATEYNKTIQYEQYNG